MGRPGLRRREEERKETSCREVEMKILRTSLPQALCHGTLGTSVETLASVTECGWEVESRICRKKVQALRAAQFMRLW